MNLVLANIDYRQHVTDEGDQLQRGLEHAGWTLAGVGYGDGCRDVPTLLERHRPEAVFVHDFRDWDPAHPGSFRKDIGFERVEALRDWPGFRATVVKDAGSVRAYHEDRFRAIAAAAAVVYYHEPIVRELNPWLEGSPLIRTYHSVDAEFCRRLVDFGKPRRRAILTGATSLAYPLRTRLARELKGNRRLGIEILGHPGYHNRGAHTPEYLAILAGYRVHVATASRYGFALRKIIESVAVGCTPVTNLPAADRLPEIDGALVRVGDSPGEVYRAVAAADRAWNPEERRHWAEKAWAFYDWRAAGERLGAALEHHAGRRSCAAS